MNKMILSAIAGVALALFSAGSALSATCLNGGALATTCDVTGGSPAGTLDYGNDIYISGTAGAVSGLIGSGGFAVAAGVTGGLEGLSLEVSSQGSTGFTDLVLKLFDANSNLIKEIDLVDQIGSPAVSFLINTSNIFFTLTGTSFVAPGPNSTSSFDITISAVPLPPAALLFGTALAGIGLLSRRRRAA